jgi:hypothetical protein
LADGSTANRLRKLCRRRCGQGTVAIVLSLICIFFFFFRAGTGTPATLYCKNCGGYLCASCDARLHPSTNVLMRKHQRLPTDSIRFGLKVEYFCCCSSLLTVRPPVFCKDHAEEEVSYFCMTCETACVCTECVVHGPHKTHDVQNIRKAFPGAVCLFCETHLEKNDCI